MVINRSENNIRLIGCADSLSVVKWIEFNKNRNPTFRRGDTAKTTHPLFKKMDSHFLEIFLVAVNLC